MNKREEMVNRLSRWQYVIGYAEGVLASTNAVPARTAADSLNNMAEEIGTLIEGLLEELPEEGRQA